MSRLVASIITCCAALSVTATAQSPASVAIADAELSAGLVKAMRAALPFPPATPEGTPIGGSVDAVWTVRWPDADAPRIEVLANPLNTGNRDRALKAEQEIQKSAMSSQLRSQGDYERAVREFERTGRAPTVREITLRDDGLAGERYDAESQLTIVAPDDRAGAPVHHLHIGDAGGVHRGSRSPGGAGGGQRLSGAGVERPAGHGPLFSRAGVGVLRAGWHPGHHAPRRRGRRDISMTAGGQPAAGRHGTVVWISGNAALVEQVLTKADWSVLRALVEG